MVSRFPLQATAISVSVREIVQKGIAWNKRIPNVAMVLRANADMHVHNAYVTHWAEAQVSCVPCYFCM